MDELPSVNRLEVVDHTGLGTGYPIGRVYMKWVEQTFKVEYSLQDDGRTLKIFLSAKEPDDTNSIDS